VTILSAALLLFLILDPLGNIPVFLSVLKPLPARRQRIVLVRELLIALAVLMVFLWGGKYALDLMHLRQESVAIAGGIVLFLIGVRMIFPRPEGLMGEIPGGEPFIVPLAIPLVAALGSFITGSATASNILFGGFQLTAAEATQLPPLSALVGQGFGAAIGNIIAPHNIVAGAATVGLIGREGRVLKKTFPLCLVYALAGGLLLLAWGQV